jgi:hypothetical protein
MKAAGIKNLNQTYDITFCEHLKKVCGYGAHACIENNPRLFNEVPREAKRYNDFKRCRAASERANSTLKETLHILEKLLYTADTEPISWSRLLLLPCFYTKPLLLL